MLDYSPDKQMVICNDKDLCFFGNFPTLAKIGARWGKSTSSAWLIPQLATLSEFCGCKSKITPEQIKECAILITQNYFYLKVSELMLFFYRFKQGKYGRFYGSVDPLVIMTALQEFLRERNDAIFDHESELNRRKAEADRKEFLAEQQDPQAQKRMEEHKRRLQKLFRTK